MSSLMRALLLAALAALATATALEALTVSAPAASAAEVVCNARGDCWSVRRHHDYQPGYGSSLPDPRTPHADGGPRRGFQRRQP